MDDSNLANLEEVEELRARVEDLEGQLAKDPLPADESGVLVAEILKRLDGVGVIGVALAALFVAMLVWQNFLLQGQGKSLQSLVQQRQTQIE